ncbi:unnamed protein product [Cochlearia groenlandica]
MNVHKIEDVKKNKHGPEKLGKKKKQIKIWKKTNLKEEKKKKKWPAKKNKKGLDKELWEKVILDSPLYDTDCVLANIFAAQFLSSYDPCRRSSYVEAAETFRNNLYLMRKRFSKLLVT